MQWLIWLAVRSSQLLLCLRENASCARFAAKLNVLRFVCAVHAQDLHWLPKTGRRTWQKSVSSVRRICSIRFSMPVTPSAEVYAHKNTHARTLMIGSCVSDVQQAKHRCLTINYFLLSLSEAWNCVLLCRGLKSFFPLLTISLLSLVPCNTDNKNVPFISVAFKFDFLFPCAQRLLGFPFIFTVLLPWNILCSHGMQSLFFYSGGQWQHFFEEDWQFVLFPSLLLSQSPLLFVLVMWDFSSLLFGSALMLNAFF